MGDDRSYGLGLTSTEVLGVVGARGMMVSLQIGSLVGEVVERTDVRVYNHSQEVSGLDDRCFTTSTSRLTLRTSLSV
jgi:hypothetical protein